MRYDDMKKAELMDEIIARTGTAASRSSTKGTLVAFLLDLDAREASVNRARSPRVMAEFARIGHSVPRRKRGERRARVAARARTT